MGANGSAEISQQLASQSKTHVKLTGLKLSRADAKQLAESTLKDNDVIRSLDLSMNQIGDLGAQELLRVLQGNVTLESLNLSGNKLQVASVAICEMLMDTNALRILDLSMNNLGDEGAMRLADILPTNSTLVRLNLSYNKIAFKGARKLWSGLLTNTRLKTLNLKGNMIGDMGTMALDNCLRANSTLISLDLAENHISESGSARVAEALRSSKGLMELMMQGNVVGDDAGVSFAQTLKTNKTLATLNLNSTKVGWVASVALGQALQVNATLASLSILNCDIGADGASALEAATKLNRQVVVDVSHPKLSSVFEDEMKGRKSGYEANEDGIMRLSLATVGAEATGPPGRQERDQKMTPQPRPSSQDYHGQSRKEVLAQIGQLNQLVEASKSDGEAGIGVRRDALERILSLAMSISDKDIILSATAMLKAVMEQSATGSLAEPAPEQASPLTPSRRTTQGSAPPAKPQLTISQTASTRSVNSPTTPRKLISLKADDRSRSTSLLTSYQQRPRPVERKGSIVDALHSEHGRQSVSPSREPPPSRSCPLHQLPLRFYDRQCGMTLCQDCTASTHKDHPVVSLFEYATQCRQELAETLAAARKVLSAAEKTKSEENAVKVALP